MSVLHWPTQSAVGRVDFVCVWVASHHYQESIQTRALVQPKKRFLPELIKVYGTCVQHLRSNREELRGSEMITSPTPKPHIVRIMQQDATKSRRRHSSTPVSLVQPMFTFRVYRHVPMSLQRAPRQDAHICGIREPKLHKTSPTAAEVLWPCSKTTALRIEAFALVKEK